MVAKSKAPTTLEEAAEAAPAGDSPVDPPTQEAQADSKPEDANPEDGYKKKKKKEKKEKTESTEADAEGSAKKKKVKKFVPAWATLSAEAGNKLAKGGALAKPKLTDAIVEAIKLCGDFKGVALASAIKSMVMSENPDCPKVSLKKALTKSIDRGLVVQVKGKGFSGSFKLGNGKPEPAVKKAGKVEKSGKVIIVPNFNVIF